ncbi:MAG TPA: cell wall-active antibiotics response protein LiaF [Sporosarcina sp.]|mgnify:CR=1 FL=1|nr:cell wall-active antibiotics response protein LiaF [Sporosarcina sp.]
MKRSLTNTVAFIGIAFIALIFIETFIFENASIIHLLLGALLLYYGTKQRAKWLFISGILFIVIALFSLWSLRIAFVVGIIYILVKLWHGVPAEKLMQPIYELNRETPNGIWKNKLFSMQSSTFSTYEWEDMHIQGLYGDFQIDVTNTVLPKGTSLISIRQAVGKVKIVLPYDIPVRIHYTTLYGEAQIFHHERKRLMNETLHMKDSYEHQTEHSPELIITIATWAGDIEVIRK